MVAHADNDNLRMRLQTGEILLRRRTKLQDKKLQLSVTHADKRHGGDGVDRIELALVRRLHIELIVDNIFLPLGERLRQLGAHIEVIGFRRSVSLIAIFLTACDDYGHLLAPNVPHGGCQAALRTEPVEPAISLTGNEEMSRLATDIVDEMPCHRDLCLRLFGE